MVACAVRGDRGLHLEVNILDRWPFPAVRLNAKSAHVAYILNSSCGRRGAKSFGTPATNKCCPRVEQLPELSKRSWGGGIDRSITHKALQMILEELSK